jgi:hypothetical protein
MNPSKASYLVERRSTDETEWCPVTYCRTMDYAQRVADMGRRRHIGVAYQAIDLKTVRGIELLPEITAKAA